MLHEFRHGGCALLLTSDYDMDKRDVKGECMAENLLML